MAATLDHVVEQLSKIAQQLNVVVGVDSQYDRTNKEQKEKKEKDVKPTLDTTEKERYRNIAKQFESVLGFSVLRDTLKQLNRTLSDQQKAKKEEERSSHIARHRYTPVTAAASKKEVTGNLSTMLKALGLSSLLTLLGGVGAFVTSMMQVGPLYGILQNISKYTSLISIKTAILAAEKLFKLITTPFKYITELFTGKTVGRLLERQVLKVGGKSLLREARTLFSFLGKGLKFFKPVPVIGSIFSFYFAWDRFKKGDITGGFLEIASGIASLAGVFPPAMPFAMALSIGLDMINLYRDVTGKSTTESKTPSTAKSWLKDKMLKLGEYISKSCYNWPVIGSLIRAYEHFNANNWLQGINSLGHAIPVVGQILDFFVKEEDPRTNTVYTGKTFADVMKQSLSYMKDKIPVISDLLVAVGKFSKGLFIDGLKALDGIIPGMSDIIEFLTPSIKTKENLRLLSSSIYTNTKQFSEWLLDKLGISWLLDAYNNSYFDFDKAKETALEIKEKISNLVGRIKDFIVSVISNTGDILKGLMSTDSDMSMKFINVITTIKPSLDKLNRELQLTISSSLKEQLNAMSQIEAVLYMQKDILEDNRSLLREIVINTRTNTNQSQIISSNSPLPSFREERSFTRTSYINDVRSMNAVVRESLA